MQPCMDALVPYVHLLNIILFTDQSRPTKQKISTQVLVDRGPSDQTVGPSVFIFWRIFLS